MEVWELKLYFYPSAGGLKKKKKSLTATNKIFPVKLTCYDQEPVTHDLPTRNQILAIFMKVGTV